MTAGRAVRRGATLVELLVALTIASVVLGAALRLVLGATRSSDRARERARTHGLYRAVGGVLSRELSGLDPLHDLAHAGPESLTVRATRGSGRTCGVDAGGVVVALASYRAWRLPDVARDSLRVPDRAGDQWITVPLLGPVSRTTCRDGTPGLRLPVADSLVTRAGLGSVAIRVVEWVRFRIYSNAEGWWLGQRSLRSGDVTQPVAGPFAARMPGFRLLDGTGSPTSDRGALRSIALGMRTQGDQAERVVVPDSIVAWVPLAGRP